ncbi:hypothetical protein QR680_012314 [Steinernema hermaphroditum]|uniref:Uncharacterized protein n=1 Tax=Steinernema hermaphroditum TaxID=289476 RepID=A0AA39LZN0_9BILA|nr:hypothetical protein QR680_012314 [Steinernema hermaphroditum]
MTFIAIWAMLRLYPFYTFLGTGICMVGSLGYVCKNVFGTASGVRNELIASGILKAAVTLFSFPVLQLLDAEYIASPFLAFRFMYFFAVVSLFFAPFSIYSGQKKVSLDRIAFEIFSSAVGSTGWIVICGFSAAVTRSTITETGHRFFWIALCSFVNGGLFMANGLIFAVHFVNNKLPSRRNSFAKKVDEEKTETPQKSLEKELEKLIAKQEAVLAEHKRLLAQLKIKAC